MTKPNLNLTGPCNVLGYGTVGYNLLMQLNKFFNVAYWPIGQIDYPVPEHLKPVIQDSINRQATFDVMAPSLRIWHQHDMAQHIGSGSRVGFPIFELTKFTERELHHLNSLDNIFVTSEWGRRIIKEEIDRPCSVIPLGVDRNIFYDFPVNSNPAPFAFLNVGKWEIRKGHDILIEAFLQAFSEDDNVELWMMNHNPFLNEKQEKQWVDYYKNNKLGDKVKLLPRVGSQKELADIMRQSHCGVFPSRAEGWNLEALEMMSCGRPVILTDYSAHTEFANSENAKLIPVNELEDAWDGIWFHGHGEWAKLDKEAVDMLSSHMQGAYADGPQFNPAGVRTAEKFTWEASAKAIFEALN